MTLHLQPSNMKRTGHLWDLDRLGCFADEVQDSQLGVESTQYEDSSPHDAGDEWNSAVLL
jgi:hypothetical protein